MTAVCHDNTLKQSFKVLSKLLWNIICIHYFIICIHYFTHYYVRATGQQ